MLESKAKHPPNPAPMSRDLVKVRMPAFQQKGIICELAGGCCVSGKQAVEISTEMSGFERKRSAWASSLKDRLCY